MKLALACAFLTLAITNLVSGAENKEKSIQLPEDNPMATLKAGPGVEVVRMNCAVCHSTDYIVRQPGSDAKQWGAEVKKMVTVYGATISDSDAKVIADYLSMAYGTAPKSEPAVEEKLRARAKIRKTTRK
jgi:sulfite dehydrogenase (cytochrome) subunit B